MLGCWCSGNSNRNRKGSLVIEGKTEKEIEETVAFLFAIYRFGRQKGEERREKCESIQKESNSRYWIYVSGVSCAHVRKT